MKYTKLSTAAITPTRGTNLYAIPDTHRAVSVDTLNRLIEETIYYASKKELQTIINKEAK